MRLSLRIISFLIYDHDYHYCLCSFDIVDKFFPKWKRLLPLLRREIAAGEPTRGSGWPVARVSGRGSRGWRVGKTGRWIGRSACWRIGRRGRRVGGSSRRVGGSGWRIRGCWWWVGGCCWWVGLWRRGVDGGGVRARGRENLVVQNRVHLRTFAGVTLE